MSLLFVEMADYRCILCMPYIKSLLSWIFQCTCLLILRENEMCRRVLQDTEFVPLIREALRGRTWNV